MSTSIKIKVRQIQKKSTHLDIFRKNTLQNKNVLSLIL